jgi:nitrogen fixation NifU-like protein
LNLKELYSEVIKDHNLSHHNKYLLKDATMSVDGKNPSCGDELTLYLKIDDNTLVDASYEGIGCAISQASASIMIDVMRGKTIDDALQLAHLFFQMIRHEPITQIDIKSLEDAAALEPISSMPARVKCATMPWHTIQEALRQTR